MRTRPIWLIPLALSACSDRSPPAPPTPPPATSISPPPAPARPPFRASLHGFKFVNSFEGIPLPRDYAPLASVLGTAIPSRFGLCGGMCAAALDFYLADLPIPLDTATPRQGSPLFDLLLQRQTDSLGPNIAAVTKFIAWMASPDRGPQGTHALSARELDALRAHLDAGTPVPLGLVFGRADGKTLLWENHQVLALAIDASGVRISIYDPNFPDDDQIALVLTPTNEAATPGDADHPIPGVSTERVSGRGRRTPVRGFFLMPYQAKSPALHTP